ncbi:MAG: hypothetical protein M1821_006409 [Bathelium mastoideum]|nr:MAG: hypothetical protein M1821_006409 [Bathelium mastoideum]KAI9693686.1 MAG: hypothetical protein M1822_002957 [Bathelium mastoideum]
METLTMNPTAPPQPHFMPIIERAAAREKTGGSVNFDPAKHLSFAPPPQVFSMGDLGLEGVGVSPVAVSQPFQLFSEEAVEQFRAEILNPEVMKNCRFTSNLAACQLRGYSPKYAPFIYDAWNNQETLAIISKIAGVDLIPVINFEIGHINLSVKSAKEAAEEVAGVTRAKQSYDDDEGIGGCPWEDDKPVVGWHTDSYPFVCVLMLSDCTNMVGGETALLKGNGEVIKVRGPQKGCAVILQGRYITHQALRALGAQERITMVTSFRPRSPYLPDDSVLTSVRPVSNLNELYTEFASYRLEMLEERVRKQLKILREYQQANKKTDTTALKAFLKEQEEFTKRTNEEIVEEEKVPFGYMEEARIPPGTSKLPERIENKE